MLNEEGTFKEIVSYWIEKTNDSLNAAKDDLKGGRFSFSVNRIYYACFYAVSAVLLQKGLRFKKHSGVRAAFHRHIVKTGLISREHGRFYDEIFEARQRGDYIELVRFEKGLVEEWLKQASEFVKAVRAVVK